MNTINKYSIFFFILLCGQVFFCQDQKKILTEKEYNRWHVIQDENIAPNGKWMSFILKYNNGNDTLVLKNIKNDKTFYYSKGSNARFSSDNNWFLYLQNQSELKILNLKTNKEQSFSGVKNYQIDKQSKRVAVLIANDSLIILDLIYGNSKVQNKVKDYSFCSNGSLAIIKQNSVTFINSFETLKEYAITSSNNEFKKIIWNQNKGFAFFEKLENSKNTNQNHSLNYYDILNHKLYSLNTDDFPELNGKSIVIPLGLKGAHIDYTDDKIFFYINNREMKLIDDKKVEVWETETPLEYPLHQIRGSFEFRDKLAVWWPMSDGLKVIGSNQKPQSIVCPKSNYVIEFNPLDYEPQYALDGNVDFYITDIKNNKTELLLENQSRKILTFGVSEMGRYLHYYRDRHWWVYDIENEKHTNITKDLPFTVENYIQDEAGPKHAFGCAGWSSDNKHIFIYDEFDIWMISADGKIKIRITNGREDKTQFRVEEELYVKNLHRGRYDFLTTTLDKNEGIVLNSMGANKNQGYHLWKENENLKTIYWANSKSSNIKIASNGKGFIWIEQDASIPPRILYKQNIKKEPINIFQSNNHYNEYGTTKGELIEYTNSKGDKLNGVLYFPTNYNKEKKYPMIVYIYERLSQRLHLYGNPSLLNRDGFSMANYVHDDYFVLYPDIIYEVGNPGISAKDCVISAVNEVIKSGKIDKDRIGIIGHSFGGYQVSSIITQTDIFKTAVAGAAITDLTILYLQMNWTWFRSQAWRLESQQLRMGSNPFNNFDGYKNNSPVDNAFKINTPLLSWSGKEDYDVNWNHSIYLHMALRKLKKKNKMLLFPNEGHNILNIETQKLLSKEIKNWFDFYLKV